MNDEPVKKLPLSGLAIAATIIGAISIIPVVGIFFGIIAIILGIIGVFTLRTDTHRGKNLAVTGIVLGVCGLLVSAGLMIFSMKMTKEMLSSSKPEMVKARETMNTFFLTQTVGSLESYKAKFGMYPDTLVTDSSSGFFMITVDLMGNQAYYRPSDDHKTFELRYSGDDGDLFTDDDLLHNSLKCETKNKSDSEE